MYFPIIDVLKENFIAKIPSIVTQWLTDNVDPVGSAVVVDTSLSISGAAADAKVTGDKISDLNSDLKDVESYLGYPRNYFDGRGLTTTKPTNWTISATKTSVTITHNNTFTSGTPTLALKLPVGEYVFHATYNTSKAFYIYIDGTYSGDIRDGSSLVIESGKTYMFEALNISSGVTQTITDISITSVNASGVLYPFAGKKWVAIGDSLTEKNESASINYVDLICSNTGLSCVNMGIGGTGYMRGYDKNKAFYQRVPNIPNDADIITIFGSGNDLGLYNQIGTPSDTGTSTICGCINTTLDYIADNFPTVPVVVIAPTIWKDQIPTENTPMTYYVQFLEEIAKKRSLHFLNLYSGGGLNPNNAAQLSALFYDQDLDGNGDGVHPNNAGHRIIAPKIKNAIECALIAD